MGRNVKGSRGWSTPRAERGRRELALTLSDETRAKLERLAAARGVSKSVIVDDLVAAAPDVGHISKNRTSKA